MFWALNWRKKTNESYKGVLGVLLFIYPLYRVSYRGIYKTEHTEHTFEKSGIKIQQQEARNAEIKDG